VLERQLPNTRREEAPELVLVGDVCRFDRRRRRRRFLHAHVEICHWHLLPSQARERHVDGDPVEPGEVADAVVDRIRRGGL